MHNHSDLLTTNLGLIWGALWLSASLGACPSVSDISTLFSSKSSFSHDLCKAISKCAGVPLIMPAGSLSAGSSLWEGLCKAGLGKTLQELADLQECVLCGIKVFAYYSISS